MSFGSDMMVTMQRKIFRLVVGHERELQMVLVQPLARNQAVAEGTKTLRDTIVCGWTFDQDQNSLIFLADFLSENVLLCRISMLTPAFGGRLHCFQFHACLRTEWICGDVFELRYPIPPYGVVAQCSATPASVAATPPCRATPSQRQIDMRHPWQLKGDRCERAC